MSNLKICVSAYNKKQEFTGGFIEIEKLNCEKYFKKALELGMSMDTDLAMANLILAGIYMQKRRKREATLLINKAKKLDSQGMLTGQIKEMKQQMKRI